uniref:NADH dehydrogenase subunit 6 n=1 Tax=Uenoa lobata TaxID=1958741 RepID=UPI0022DCDB79|nr:NADH dehydrogenase subunit 6 [Uenoa lobata]UZZ44452.1 NADH dehydrogenase subunit 6 [Uenoa lobata]
MLKFQLFITLLMTMNLLLVNLTHPLVITIIMILQTYLMSFIMGMMSNSFWMIYIMFLCFIGGLLILFIYISSLTPNKIFYINQFSSMIMFLMINFITLNILMKIYPKFINLEMTMFNKFNFLMINTENSIFLWNFLNYNEIKLSMLMIIYLLITMIIVIKIVNLNLGPMRIMS